MSKYLLHYCWVVLLIGVYACSGAPAELTTAERLIETATDSALHILQRIPASNLSSDKNRALYGLLMIRTLDKKLLPLKPDSILDFCVAYYETHPDHDRLAMCYLYKGRTYKYYFQYERAMNYYLKALDEAKDSKDNMLLGRIYMDMGDIFNIQNDYIKSREKYEIAFKNFSDGKGQQLAFYALLNIGRTYRIEKDFAKANNYFKRISPFAKDSMQRGDLYQEIGRNFFDVKQYDSAILYYKRIIKYPYISYNRAIRYYNLSNLFYNTNEIDSAFLYAFLALKYEPLIRTQRDCYRILANSEFLRGHIHEMSMYMNKYVQLSDSIRKIDAQIKGSYMETTHLAKKEATKNKYLAWYLIGLVIVLVVVGYYLFRLFSTRNKKEKKQIHEVHIEEKVDMRKKVIVDKRAVLQQKIEERKTAVLSGKKGLSLSEREDKIKEIYNDLLHTDDTNFFFSEMDVVLNGLVSKLRTRYKGLNDKELIWCCLSLFRISRHDMLILLSYKTPNSIKVLKSRLSDKFELDNATLLGDFLLKILSED